MSEQAEALGSCPAGHVITDSQWDGFLFVVSGGGLFLLSATTDVFMFTDKDSGSNQVGGPGRSHGTDPPPPTLSQIAPLNISSSKQQPVGAD